MRTLKQLLRQLVSVSLGAARRVQQLMGGALGELEPKELSRQLFAAASSTAARWARLHLANQPESFPPAVVALLDGALELQDALAALAAQRRSVVSAHTALAAEMGRAAECLAAQLEELRHKLAARQEEEMRTGEWSGSSSDSRAGAGGAGVTREDGGAAAGRQRPLNGGGVSGDGDEDDGDGDGVAAWVVNVGGVAVPTHDRATLAAAMEIQMRLQVQEGVLVKLQPVWRAVDQMGAHSREAAAAQQAAVEAAAAAVRAALAEPTMERRRRALAEELQGVPAQLAAAVTEVRAAAAAGAAAEAALRSALAEYDLSLEV
ncbi:hypothetical protein PLESTF_001692700 [Pleodorina starrii]|nr:hypothetical protein PLESTM_000768000 [Pleodorina starrii]GLC75835.1 hypothetical protein PLESTF_001692700 [Pleodorina starrii]